MAIVKRKNVGGEVGRDHVGINYSNEILQQIVTIGVGEMKMIPHSDGCGFSIVTRFDTVTFRVVTKRFVIDGVLNHRLKDSTEVIEFKPEGAYINGRKL